MEDKQDVNEEHYVVDSESMWRETLSDGLSKFKNVIPAYAEFQEKDLKKKELPEFSEAKILKTFKVKSGSVFNKGNLVFCSKDGKLYKVVDLRNDDSGKTSWVSLVSRDGAVSREVDSQADLADFEISSEIYIMISPANKDSSVVGLKLKIYEKIETTLEPAFEGLGLLMLAFKFFFQGKELDKSLSVAQIEAIG
eukprot:CAMPEP_0168333334 /NCGR_PEP_ID=MMETSP0213-20121227/9549_1 /TAXON_ID=151035 /ORGANISM="Euplotes harpa, Strain FSP1.4" /LENGTH=194 /DNA_ID=CAMNT_0008337645 /DNA_START=11 /DNA_END=595 /DNA_ORIENTATION=+